MRIRSAVKYYFDYIFQTVILLCGWIIYCAFPGILIIQNLLILISVNTLKNLTKLGLMLRKFSEIWRNRTTSFVHIDEFMISSERNDGKMSVRHLFLSYFLYLIPPLFIAASMTLVSPDLTICTDLKAPFLINNRNDFKNYFFLRK